MEEPHPHNTTTMTELPIDIIKCEILPRLPPKSLGRSKCVCKEWLFFFSTQEFATMYRRHITAVTKLLFVDKKSDSIRKIDCESPDHVSTAISPIPFEARPSDVLVLASLDGLVCLCLIKTCELVIWNPVTRAYKKLPNSKSQGFFKIYVDVVGLYIDSSNDYKILHIKRRRGTMGAYIYSRRLDSWRKIEFLKRRQRIYNYEWSSVTFSGDSLYFIVSEWCIEGETMIIGFDVNSEKFKEIRYPCVSRVYGDSCHGNLVNVGNRLHLFVSYGFPKWTVDLWRMDVGEKWTKVAAVSGIENIPLPVTPRYVMSNGKWLVTWDWIINKDVCEIDIKTNDYICIDTKTKDDCVLTRHWYPGLQVTYKETIVSPNL